MTHPIINKLMTGTVAYLKTPAGDADYKKRFPNNVPPMIAVTSGGPAPPNGQGLGVNMELIRGERELYRQVLNDDRKEINQKFGVVFGEMKNLSGRFENLENRFESHTEESGRKNATQDARIEKLEDFQRILLTQEKEKQPRKQERYEDNKENVETDMKHLKEEVGENTYKLFNLQNDLRGRAPRRRRRRSH